MKETEKSEKERESNKEGENNNKLSYSAFQQNSWNIMPPVQAEEEVTPITEI